MKSPRFGPMVLAVVLVCCIIFLPEHLWARWLPQAALQKAAPSYSLDLFKNAFLQDGAYVQNGYLPMYGSSTIGLFSNYHPSEIFPQQKGDPVPFLIGQSAVSGIIQLLDISQVRGMLNNRKLVYVLDPSDFMNPKGMADKRFGQVYSPIKGYSFLFNHDLTKEDQRKEAERLLQFSVIQQDGLLKTELQGIIHPDFNHRLQALLHLPETYLYYKVLEKVDMLDAIKLLPKFKPFKRPTLPANPSWDNLMLQAEQAGAQQTKSNPYGFLDSIYKKNFEFKLKNLKGSWHPGNYLQSVEYGDLQGVLDILKAEHANPLFVIPPQKGGWADYIGFNEYYRKQLYDKIKGEVTAAGFPVIDYSGYEYDPYFMRDTMHLGWTGWIYLDKDLRNYYKDER